MGFLFQAAVVALVIRVFGADLKALYEKYIKPIK